MLTSSSGDVQAAKHGASFVRDWCGSTRRSNSGQSSSRRRRLIHRGSGDWSTAHRQWTLCPQCPSRQRYNQNDSETYPSLQWSFRKTGTMGTLASQAETDIWVRFWDEPGYKPQTNLEIVCAKSCNPVHFGRKMVRNAAHNAFLIILTIGTQFLCVHPRRGPCFPTSSFPGESPPYRRTNRNGSSVGRASNFGHRTFSAAGPQNLEHSADGPRTCRSAISGSRWRLFYFVIATVGPKRSVNYLSVTPFNCASEILLLTYLLTYLYLPPTALATQRSTICVH